MYLFFFFISNSHSHLFILYACNTRTTGKECFLLKLDSNCKGSYVLSLVLSKHKKKSSNTHTHTGTSKGFVPNFSGGGDKSIDRTEPPVGGMILKEIWDKFHDDWIVHLLFPDLVAWNDWFVRERTWCQ